MAPPDGTWAQQLVEALRKMCALTQALKDLKDAYNAELASMRIGSPEEVRRTEKFLNDQKANQKELRKAWRKAGELMGQLGYYWNSPLSD